jgi:TRAP-type C4-dicarboxylate transport system substrate-binding protein
MRKRNQLTALGGICLSLLITALLFSSACSQPTPPSSPASTPPPVSKPAPIVLKYAHQAPPTSLVAQYAHTPRKQQIEEATKGRVTVELYPAETLGKQSEQYQMARTGVCDITWGFTGLVPGKFPFSEIVTLPFLPSALNVRIGSLSLVNLFRCEVALAPFRCNHLHRHQ